MSVVELRCARCDEHFTGFSIFDDLDDDEPTGWVCDDCRRDDA